MMCRNPPIEIGGYKYYVPTGQHVHCAAVRHLSINDLTIAYADLRTAHTHTHIRGDIKHHQYTS